MALRRMMERESPARPDSAPAAAMVSTATATVVIVACGFATGLIAARSLGPAGRGELAAITLWASILLYAGTLGLPEAVAYFSAADPASRERVWTTGQVGGTVLGLLVTIVGWVLIPAVFAAGDAALAQTIRWYLALFAVPAMWSLCATSWLQGVCRLRAFNMSRAAVPLANAVGLTTLWALGDRSVLHFAAALLVGNAVGGLVATGFGPLTRIAAAPPTLDLAQRMFRYGLRVQIGNWSNAASVRLDQLLLSLFAPAASLGLYVVAVSYAGILLMIPASAALVMLPEVVRQHEAGMARACLERWSRRLFWATVLVGCMIAPLGIMAVPALFGTAFQGAVPLAALLVPATVTLGMNQVFSAAFRGVGRPDISSTSEVVGVVVTVAALAALLPRYGVYGAATASLLAYGASHLYLARKAVVIFDTDVKSLYLPIREDVRALRRACASAAHRVSRAASRRSVTQAL